MKFNSTMMVCNDNSDSITDFIVITISVRDVSGLVRKGEQKTFPNHVD